MAGENIKLRYVKGNRLTFTEMDNNFSQFVYSGSISGTGSSRALKLHYTGSSTLGIDYVPRTGSISIPGHWIISDGSNNEVINPGDTVNFVGNGATTVSYTAGINTVTITGVDEDVTVSNLRTRLGQISDNTTIGDATDVTMTFSGDVDVVGTLTAKEFHTTVVSASILYQSGSTLFGDSSDDKHEFTGSIVGSQTSNIIPFYYANQAAFPSATSFHGAIAHSHADAGMYYAHGGSWVKLVSSTDTPSTLNVSSSNAITATSHTHAILTTTAGAASTIVATDASSEITAANFITTSDRRLKSEIEPIKDGLAVIKNIASYEYIKNNQKEAGFIAQDIQEVLPYAVREGEDGYLKMTDRAILAHLHKAVQQLEERLSAVEEKLG